MPDLSAWSDLSIDSALVLFCDLQKQIVAKSQTQSPRKLRSAAGVLLQIAELLGVPVMQSVVPEGGQAPVVIRELRKAEPQLLRTGASPFRDEATREAVAASGRKVLILAGFAAEVVVLHAGIDALAAGYRVLVATDACGGLSERTEGAALRHLEAAGALLSSVVSLATRLEPDFSSERGQQLFALARQL